MPKAKTTEQKETAAAAPKVDETVKVEVGKEDDDSGSDSESEEEVEETKEANVEVNNQKFFKFLNYELLKMISEIVGCCFKAISFREESPQSHVKIRLKANVRLQPSHNEKIKEHYFRYFKTRRLQVTIIRHLHRFWRS